MSILLWDTTQLKDTLDKSVTARQRKNNLSVKML